MNYPMHERVTQLAWHSLPAAEREAWGLGVAIPDFAPAQVKQHAPTTLDEKWSVYGNSLDMMGWRTAEARSYPPWLLPNGSTIPHGSVDPAGVAVWCGDQAWDPASWRETPRYLVPRIVEAIAAGDHERAALTLAPLLHFLEDSACLGHVVPNRWFYEMFELDRAAWPHVHGIFDGVDPELRPAEPRSLGQSVAEVVMRIGLLGEWLYDRNRANFVALVQAALAGDRERLRTIKQPIYQRLVETLAGLFHTVWRLGKGEPTASAGPVSLAGLPAWLIHPGGKYGACLPVGHNIVDGAWQPLTGQRDGAVTPIADGLGLTSFHGARYLLEPGVFEAFEGSIGLSPDYRHDQDMGLSVSLVVCTAPEWTTQITSDLRYGPPLREVLELELKPGELQPFRVEPGDARTLLWGIRPQAIVVDGADRCPFPHVVLADPRLTPHA